MRSFTELSPQPTSPVTIDYISSFYGLRGFTALVSLTIEEVIIADTFIRYLQFYERSELNFKGEFRFKNGNQKNVI